MTKSKSDAVLVIDLAKGFGEVTGTDWVGLAVEDIAADIQDRRGIKYEWHKIDPHVQAEIKETWREIHLSRSSLPHISPVL